jgi:dTDP-4-dehydrorhamnose reductase
VTVDDYHIRYPTSVDDVARVLLRMTCKSINLALPPTSFQLINLKAKQLEGEKLKGIFHFSSEDKRTKYTMCLAIGKALGINTEHIRPDSMAPKDPLGNLF